MPVNSRTGASIWGIALVLSKLSKAMGSKRRDAQLLTLADAQDVMRMDSDLG